MKGTTTLPYTPQPRKRLWTDSVRGGQEESQTSLSFGKYQLKRPLVLFDLETTGTSITQDRIIEIGVLKLYPERDTCRWDQRINPTVPIPPAVS